MAFPPRLALATKNAHKLRELMRICGSWPVEWVTVQNSDPSAFPDVEETGETYLENALLKARAGAPPPGGAARAGATGIEVGAPALADDSGIEVDALGGGPGHLSARYAGPDASDQQNLNELIRAVRGVPSGGRTARYRCFAVLAYPDGSLLHAEGVCEGSLILTPRGQRGFGYDPIFVPEGWDQTMAELTDDQKDRVSHRGRAFRALEGILRQAD